MNLNKSLKLGNLIFTPADFAKFIYKTLDICSQQNNNNYNTYIHTKIHICPGKSECHIVFSRLFSYLLKSMKFISNLT